MAKRWKRLTKRLAFDLPAEIERQTDEFGRVGPDSVPLAFHLLAKANRCAGDRDFDEAWNYMRMSGQASAWLKDHWAFNTLYGATAMEITRLSLMEDLELTGIQARVAKRIGSLIPGARLVRRKNQGKGRPDHWVEVDGVFAPVEVKRRAFDAKAVEQLARYMRENDCGVGYAVAPILTAPLLDGMTFVPCL